MIPFDFHAQSITPGERTIVVPADLESKEALLAFLGQAIPLPDYFGQNWDALEECLTDLTWLPDSKLALVHQDVPLDSAPADQRTYVLVLANAVRVSDRLRVIFPAKCRHHLASLL